MSENLLEHSITTPSDREILEGFFFHSRYITKDVLNRYGLNPIAYTTTIQSNKLSSLKTRLTEILSEKKNINVQSLEELHNLLGSEFSWVRVV